MTESKTSENLWKLRKLMKVKKTYERKLMKENLWKKTYESLEKLWNLRKLMKFVKTRENIWKFRIQKMYESM